MKKLTDYMAAVSYTHLGLCIAREIVTLHKGSIRILDTPGGGSTFVIRLPK